MKTGPLIFQRACNRCNLVTTDQGTWRCPNCAGLEWRIMRLLLLIHEETRTPQGN